MPGTLRLLAVVALVASLVFTLRAVLAWGGGPPDSARAEFADVMGPTPELAPGEVLRVVPAPAAASSIEVAGATPFLLAMPVAGVEPRALRGSFDERRGRRRHDAIDILAPRGTPVLAVADGRVVQLLRGGLAGTALVLADAHRPYTYFYAHLDRYARGLRAGDEVRRGDVLGYVGTTGNAPPQTPHLHFQVRRLDAQTSWWRGSPVDPLPLLHPAP